MLVAFAAFVEGCAGLDMMFATYNIKQVLGNKQVANKIFF